MKTKLLKSLAATALLASLPFASLAQGAPTAAQIAAYEGANRQTVLLEGAKKEGELLIYYSHPIVQRIVDAYSAKYGLKAKTWRSGSEGIVQRITAEQKANKHDLDIFFVSSNDLESFAREKIVLEVRSPYHKDLTANAVPAHRQWVGVLLNVFTAAYNTKLVKKEDLPKSYEDLLDPKWKGKLAVEANDQMWYGALTAGMGEERGRKLFQNIVATNGMSVRKGHSLLAGLVAAGEVPLALTVYDWNVPPLKRKNAPIEALFIPPLYATMSGLAMTSKPRNPHAAALFYDFVLNEGQKMLFEADYIPTSTKFKSPISNMKFNIIDAAQFISNNDKWVKMYDEDIIKKAR